MNQPHLTPLEHLQALAKCSLGSQVLDSGLSADPDWHGYTFRVGHWDFVFPASNGIEIVSSQVIQPIPWVKHWVRGVTNIRGDIYSVVDFADFLGLGAVSSEQSVVLLKLPDDQLKSALLLEKWVNLRSFSGNLNSTEVSEMPASMDLIVNATLTENEKTWVVLDADRLCQHPEFTTISNPLHLEQSSSISTNPETAGWRNAAP